MAFLQFTVQTAKIRNIRWDLHGTGIKNMSLNSMRRYLAGRYTRSMLCTE